MRMRDLLDLSMVMKLDTFGKKNACEGNHRLAVEQARKHFKLGEKQTIKLFHILRAYYKQEPLTLQETEVWFKQSFFVRV